MNKKIKRFLSLALALVMVIGLMPASRVFAEGEQASSETANYRWETTEDGTELVNITTEGYTANGFTENVGGTVTGRKLVQYYAELENTIMLHPADEWEIEWKATNSTGKNASAATTLKGTGRILLCSGPKAAATGAQSVYLAEMYAMCQYGGPLYASAYNQLGNKLASGADGRSGVNTYTIKNVPGEDGAVIQLYVNGEYAADLNKVYKTGTEKADVDGSALANATYYFNYIGDVDSWNLGSPEFHYLEIRNAHVHGGEWIEGEDGLTKTCSCGYVETAPYTAYRWEINAAGDDVVSVETNGYYVENPLTGTTGTVAEGNLSGFKRIIDNEVSMDHTKPWIIEWKAAGTWRGMLLSKTSGYSTVGNVFVYHPEAGKPYSLGSKFTHPSNSTEAFWNYGFTKTGVANAFTAAGKTFVESDVHTFRIENRISDGVSVWYLIIDEVEIGAMTNVFNGSKTSPTFTDDTLLMQQDFGFGYIGATSKLFNADDFGYIEIWPNGKPAAEEHVCDFSIEQEVFKGADCETPGYTVWACECGETEERPNEVYGDHDYYAETSGEPGPDCQTPGEDYFVCSVCGDDYTESNSVYGEHSFTVYVETVRGSTCQVPSYDVYRCEFCEETENRPNDAVVGYHNFSVVVDTVPAENCQTMGYIVFKCEYCDETREVPDLIYGEHRFTEFVETVNGANCQTPGYDVYKCQFCDATEERENAEAVGDHNYATFVETVKGADCQTGGYDVYKCACGETENRENAEAVGDHNYATFVETVKGADCQTPGYDVYKCQFCDATEERENAEAVGDHSFGQWYLDEETQTMVRDCIYGCGAKDIGNVVAKDENGDVLTDEEGNPIVGNTLEEVLDQVADGTIIALSEDTVIENDLVLDKSVSLELNGNSLTVAEGASIVVTKGSTITGDGVLYVDQGNLLFEGSNPALPMWNGEGYIFAEVEEETQSMSESVVENTEDFYFLPDFSEEVHEFLTDDSIKLYIYITWTKGGEEEETTVQVPADLIEQFLASYADGHYEKVFKLRVKNTEGIENLKYQIYFESCGAIYYV